MEFKLTLEEAQRIVNYLSEYPYKEVADIIDNIKKQYNEQNTEK
jgi:hypothetical protein